MTLASRRSALPPTLGLDFGTTNSVAAIADPSVPGGVREVGFPDGAITHSVFRSALDFWQTGSRQRLETLVEGGPWAIAHFVESPEGSRFLQSFKTFAASSSFRSTVVHGRSFRFEDLLATFLDRLAAHADPDVLPLPRRLIAGRPVTFAGGAPDPQLAQSRYDAAFSRAGFDEIHYVHEPVAAAFWFARRLTREATVLVADFGGGTSDFSIVRFTVDGHGVTAHPLAQTGVGIAGDGFDYRIIDAVVSPKLGKGSRYESFGKWLEMPAHYYAAFARWNQLAIMKTGETLRELNRLAGRSDDPTGLEQLIEVIEEDLGYPLYKAVSEVKFALSHAEEAQLSFRHRDIAIEATVRRADFERWIAGDLEKIAAALDEALARAGLADAAIDRVFLTGGTSFVPAVRRMFTDRFGASRVETGDQLLSIAYGLALIGAEEDVERWTVREAAVA
ncbi:Hsp70 family protein [Siculibacillus lacustris]|uniref:Hsp70 family protein n=1 Tax=Siculibacillus lacustris TaxID=1549641 RepID=A0A4Q9VWE7_9HYPH|nr:Hsp70 family protein [Siculibacillus lacustris]TBW40642.1 Hsp70 family protein [Siculibacillus lacustris]